ncbi:MAG: class I SAM-dependent methyltransferase [Ignavibacteriaceae bacterium]|nr:class I SAM-dependent methyltransferase [Ignavibacteriaceae bacterium]
MLNNQEFFDELSDQYDSMIPFEKAIEMKKKLFKNLLKGSNKTIADVGCGTGSDSLALVEMGYKVVSFDSSTKMLDKARLNARSRGLDLDSYHFGALEITDDFNGNFDIVISFGNTFANIETEIFQSSIKKCYDLLNEQGSLFIQVLNYDLILKEKKRIVNITENEEHFFIRFYDFIKNDVKFNILKFSKIDTKENKLMTTTVHPHTAKDFNNSILKAGFKSVKLFSDSNRNIFDVYTSKDLIIEAVKS